MIESSADNQTVTAIIQIAGILTNSLIFFATLLKMMKIQREALMVGLHPAITTLIIQQGKHSLTPCDNNVLTKLNRL